MLLTSTSLADTPSIAEKIISQLGDNTVVCFYGEMGAGKTTTIQEVAKLLGVTGRVLSPTFILMRRHKIPSRGFMFHADMYRLNDSSEAKALGLEELWQDQGNLVFIEWPEKIQDLLPHRRLEVKSTKINEAEREIEIAQT